MPLNHEKGETPPQESYSWSDIEKEIVRQKGRDNNVVAGKTAAASSESSGGTPAENVATGLDVDAKARRMFWRQVWVYARVSRKKTSERLRPKKSTTSSSISSPVSANVKEINAHYDYLYDRLHAFTMAVCYFEEEWSKYLMSIDRSGGWIANAHNMRLAFQRSNVDWESQLKFIKEIQKECRASEKQFLVRALQRKSLRYNALLYWRKIWYIRMNSRLHFRRAFITPFICGTAALLFKYHNALP